MTYGDLLKHLHELSPEQLRMTVTVYDANDDETFGIGGFAITGQEDEQDCRPEEDILDSDHPYMLRGGDS